MKISFKEIQRFTQWWLWTILIVIGCLPFYSVYKRINSPIPFFTSPLKDVSMLLFSVLVFGIIYLFSQLKLIIIIDNKEIILIFKPFAVRVIKWEDITEAKIVNYGFAGGWGIRYGSKHGTIYNTNGRIGLAIKNSKGEKFVIGTKRPNELNKIIQNKLINKLPY